MSPNAVMRGRSAYASRTKAPNPSALTSDGPSCACMHGSLGSRAKHVITISSPLGTQCPQAAGVAFAMKQMARPQVAVPHTVIAGTRCEPACGPR